jgi:hypothetical protein
MTRTVGSVLAVLVAVSVTIWIRDRAPHPEDWQGPFVGHADIGEAVEVGELTITVEGLDGGRGLVIGPNDPLPTGGVWLVVMVAITADRAPAAVESVQLIDDRGRSFDPASTYRFDQPIIGLPVQPGTAARGGIAFEVPFDVGEHVALRVGPDYTILDAVTDVGLSVAADDWAAWSTEGSEVELPRRTVEAV